MASGPLWLLSIKTELEQALANSQIVRCLKDEDQALIAGRQFSLDLWPFINELPDNVKHVRNALSSEKQFSQAYLGSVADEEKIYRNMFLEQCYLAGLSNADMENGMPSKQAAKLASVVRHACFELSAMEGLLAIIAAEISASCFSRVVYPIFEIYFAKRTDEFDARNVEKGLAWLKLHAYTDSVQTKLFLRMLKEIDLQYCKNMPAVVQDVLDAVKHLWQCVEGIDLNSPNCEVSC